MADDLTQRGPLDASRISLSEEWEISYGTKSLGVSREELDLLVREHGNSAGVRHVRYRPRGPFSRSR